MSTNDPWRAVDKDIERLRDQILELAVKYGARHGVGLSTVSKKVADDGKFLPDLKGKGPEQMNFTVGKYRKVMHKLLELLGPPSDTQE